jgi:hypothetical protein
LLPSKAEAAVAVAVGAADCGCCESVPAAADDSSDVEPAEEADADNKAEPDEDAGAESSETSCDEPLEMPAAGSGNGKGCSGSKAKA